jgi:hypothetical protein
MEQEQDPLDRIQRMLENKSTAKQITYKNLLAAFDQLSKEAKRVTGELKKKSKPGDQDVTIDFKKINDHEFQIKLAGDMLVFVLHTNIVTFEEESEVMKDPYIREKEINRYFGQIMIYNFMSDSIKYNRVNDPGYLLARLLVNHEGRYIVEGEYNKVFSKLGDLPDNSSFIVTVVQKNGQDARLHYVVIKRKEFSPTDQEQFRNTGDSLVALSTCWPIGSTKSRLVVFGKLTQVEK